VSGDEECSGHVGLVCYLLVVCNVCMFETGLGESVFYASYCLHPPFRRILPLRPCLRVGQCPLFRTRQRMGAISADGVAGVFYALLAHDAIGTMD
jgi:hypothetical protein